MAKRGVTFNVANVDPVTVATFRAIGFVMGKSHHEVLADAAVRELAALPDAERTIVQSIIASKTKEERTP